MYRTSLYFAWNVLLAIALWGFPMPLQAGEDRLERTLTTHERIMVQDALNAYSLQIDPEYYLSGDYLEDLRAHTPEARKRRLFIRRHQDKIEQRHREHQYHQQKIREQRERQAEEYRREQLANQAKRQAKNLQNQRYRCNLIRHNRSNAANLARTNPNYVYRQPPMPVGC